MKARSPRGIALFVIALPTIGGISRAAADDSGAPSSARTGIEIDFSERFGGSAGFDRFSGVNTPGNLAAPSKTETEHVFPAIGLRYLGESRGLLTPGIFVNALLPHSVETTLYPQAEAAVTKHSSLGAIELGLSFTRAIARFREDRDELSVGIDPSIGFFRANQDFQGSSSGTLTAYAWSYRAEAYVRYARTIAGSFRAIVRAGYAYTHSSAYWSGSSTGGIYSDLRSNGRVYSGGEKFRTNFSTLVATAGLEYRFGPAATTESPAPSPVAPNGTIGFPEPPVPEPTVPEPTVTPESSEIPAEALEAPAPLTPVEAEGERVFSLPYYRLEP